MDSKKLNFQHQNQDPQSQFHRRLKLTCLSCIIIIIIVDKINIYTIKLQNSTLSIFVAQYLKCLYTFWKYSIQQLNIKYKYQSFHINIRLVYYELSVVIKIQPELMSEQLKQNLQIYLETNRTFIEQKLYDQFKYECLKNDELKKLKIFKLQKIIKEVFSFGESAGQSNSNDQFMSTFFKRIPDNIKKFIDEQYKKKSDSNQHIIDIDKLMEIVHICIQQGFDKTVQVKPIIKQPQNPQKIENVFEMLDDDKKDKLQIKKPKIIQPIQQIKPQPQKVKKFYVPKPKTPQIKNFIQKHEMPQKKMPARYLQHMANKIKKGQEQKPIEYIAPIDLSYLQKNKQIINSRLEDLYNHYCSQQQNTGIHSTFDNIKQQLQRMNVGKFLLFCKSTKLFQQKQINNQFIMGKFKKVSDGKKQIKYDKFKQLLTIVDQQFIKLRKKKLGEQTIVPSYQARLLLQNKQYKKLKKTVQQPFITNSIEKNKIHNKYEKINKTIQATIKKYDKRDKDKLTPHSGKFIQDIKYELQRRSASQNTKIQQTQKNKIIDKSTIIKLDNLKYNDLAGMQWILQQSHDNNNAFMKQYTRKDVVTNTKKRVKDLEKLEKYSNY